MNKQNMQDADQYHRYYNLENEEETTFTLSDSLHSQMKRDADDLKKLITQLTCLDVFRVNTALREDITADEREGHR